MDKVTLTDCSASLVNLSYIQIAVCFSLESASVQKKTLSFAVGWVQFRSVALCRLKRRRKNTQQLSAGKEPHPCEVLMSSFLSVFGTNLGMGWMGVGVSRHNDKKGELHYSSNVAFKVQFALFKTCLCCLFWADSAREEGDLVDMKKHISTNWNIMPVPFWH